MAHAAAIHAIDPWTRTELEVVPANDRADALAAVEAARAAQAAWGDLGFAARRELLRQVRDRFAARAEALVELLGQENGKPPVEAWFAEILPDIDLFNYWLRETPRFMADEKLKLERTKYPGKKGVIRRVPKGVVGVISAWNFPIALSLRAVVPALMSGNTVVFKPSSDAVLSGRALAECFTEVLPPGVFVPFHGPGALGSALIEAGLDHLVFIGSVEVGREVAALAGRQLTSVALELGGKDAAIVMPDADLDRAVEGIAWGAFSNCGQNCASIERLMVHEQVADAFVEKLVERVRRLRVGADSPGECDVGPLRSQGQLRAVEAQLAAAVDGGARVLCGGRRVGDGYGFEPTVLDDVTDAMDVWTVETFGPLLPIRRVSSVEEAIDLANDSDYGLTTSLWTSNLPLARALATRLDCGVVTVNNHAYTGAMPFAPWGGTKQTGIGSTNSHHALAEMTRPQVVVTDPPRGHEFFWYPYDRLNLELAQTLRRFLTGGGGMFKVLGLIKRAAKAREPVVDEGGSG